MSFIIASLAVMVLLIAFAFPSAALPLASQGLRHAMRSEAITNMLMRRDDQGVTHGWNDMSGSAKAGVVLAPTLGFAFVLFAAFFVMQEKRKERGQTSLYQKLPCFRPRRIPKHAKKLSNLPAPAMRSTGVMGGAGSAGIGG